MKKKKKGRSPEDYAIMFRMGKMIRRRRDEKMDLEGKANWTQPALGERLDVSSQTIGYVERGTKWPGPALLVKLSEELGLKLDDILRRKEFQSSQADGDRAKVSGE